MIHPEEVEQIYREVAAEIAEAVALSEAGTWEPASELTRFTYGDTAAQAEAASHE
jgi:hypothetical protein